MKIDLSDETLFQEFLDGDEDSFRVLMERYGDRLTVYIAGRVADVHEAEDLMIESFARMIHAAPRLKGGEGSFRGYLFKTARTVLTRFNRNYQLKKTFSFEELYSEPGSGGTEELPEMMRDELSRTILACMDRLRPEYREALYLMYFEDMKIAEIAGVMKKSPMAVDQLLRRGRKAMKTELEKEGITDVHY